MEEDRSSFSLPTTVRKYLVVWVAVLVGLVWSIVVFGSVRQREWDRLQVELDRRAQNQAAALQRGLDRNQEVVRSISGLFSASYQVERDEFRAFVKGALATHPDIRALQWVPRVRDFQKTSFEEAARRDGLSDFRFTQRSGGGKLKDAGWKKEYFPVFYLEPKEGNEKALGFNTASDPVLLETLRRARDTRRMVSTPWLPLESWGGDQLHFLLFQPVFMGGSHFENFSGFAVGVFKVGTLMDESLKGLELGGIDIYIREDSGPAGPTTLYRVEPPGVERLEREALGRAEAELLSGLNWKAALDVPGRRWEILFHGSPSFITVHKRWQEWEVTAVGLVLTFALGTYLFTSTRRAAELAQANKELQEAYESLKKAQASAIVAEKLAAIGRLTAGISHEIMNPLFAISANIHALLKEPHIPEDVSADLGQMKDHARRIEKIAQDLLSFSRRRTPDRRSLSLNEVVEKALDLVKHDLRIKKIAVEKSLAEDLPTVAADEDQLNQVIINLLTNARDAMGEDGRVIIRTGLVKSDGARALELRVEDTGPGIDTENMADLFEPFYTTKPEGEGTGLGLAICHGIIEAHGGSIWAENAPEGGAVFLIRLNAEEDMANKILIVDDEAFVRKALQKILKGKGFSVTEASSGDEALASYQEERPDVVILDVRMPGKDGIETLKELKAQDPEASVIMLTALHDEELARQALDEGAFEYITKSTDLDYLEMALMTKIALATGGDE